MSRSVDLPISRLKVSPFNVRKTYVQNEEFDANIKSLGVLEPLIVRKLDEDYEVIVGQCRFEAAKKAGIERVRCNVHDVRDMSDAEAVLESFSENVARHDLSVTERAIALAQLLGRDELLEAAGVVPEQRLNIEPFSEAKLGEVLGLCKTILSRFLEPLQLQPKTRELLETGAISQKAAEEIRKYAATSDDEVELAEAFAEANKDKGAGATASKKPTLNRDGSVAILRDAVNKDLPKEKIIETLKEKRDPTYPAKEEREDDKADEWVPIESVTIDGCAVTDPSIIAPLNKHRIRPASHAQDILRTWLEKKGYF